MGKKSKKPAAQQPEEEIGTLRRHEAARLGIQAPLQPRSTKSLKPATRKRIREATARFSVEKRWVEKRCRLGDPSYEIAPGRRVYVKPVEGAEKIFDVKGVRVELMRNTDGEFILELSVNGKVLGTAFVVDHLKITKG